MNFSLTAPVLLLDCQTTGHNPHKDHLLELAWAWSDSTSEQVECRRLAVPDGVGFSPHLKRITGLKSKEWNQGESPKSVFEALSKVLGGQDDFTRGVVAPVVSHYASFEKSFLKPFFAAHSSLEKFPSLFICSYRLAKWLWPQLGSHTIRALAGYYGFPMKKRFCATSHVRATGLIWTHIVDDLKRRGYSDLSQVLESFEKKEKVISEKSRHRIPREKRLALPKAPGVYHFISPQGQVLYVGKATNLHSRVNSYFRSQRSLEARKRELIAQSWDVKVRCTASVLEAALLEVDHIKEYAPAYNIALQSGRRKILFYSRDLVAVSDRPTPLCSWGPFVPGSGVDRLLWLHETLKVGHHLPVFFTPIERQTLLEAFEIFCKTHGIEKSFLETPRRFVALAVWLMIRDRAETGESGREAEEQSSAIEESYGQTENETKVLPDQASLTPDEVARKIFRLFVRAGRECHRRLCLKRLADSNTRWEERGEVFEICVRKGQVCRRDESSDEGHPIDGQWRVEDYDRLRVLWSELNKCPHWSASV